MKLLPFVRQEVARELVSRGMSQHEVSSRLGISQAMVSKYLAPKGGGNYLDATDAGPQMRESAQALVQDLVAIMERGGKEQESILATCRACLRARTGGQMCKGHSRPGCSACTQLAGLDLSEDKREVLEDMESALAKLEGLDAAMLSPEVRMNLAQAVKGAEGSRDVASVPGRLAEVHGRVVAVYPPEFGASSHLSALLLAVMKGRPGTRAVMNIKLDPAVEDAAARAGLRSKEFLRGRGQDLFDFASSAVDCDVVYDRGDFGVEPCTYVLGADALEVMKKVGLILDRYAPKAG